MFINLRMVCLVRMVWYKAEKLLPSNIVDFLSHPPQNTFHTLERFHRDAVFSCAFFAVGGFPRFGSHPRLKVCVEYIILESVKVCRVSVYTTWLIMNTKQYHTLFLY